MNWRETEDLFSGAFFFAEKVLNAKAFFSRPFRMIMANLCVVTLLVSYLSILIHGSLSESQPADWDDEDDQDPGESAIIYYWKAVTVCDSVHWNTLGKEE